MKKFINRFYFLLTILLFSITTESYGNSPSTYKDYANYNDWQMNILENPLVEKWTNIERECESFTKEEYISELNEFYILSEQELSKENTFEFAKEYSALSKELLSSIKSLIDFVNTEDEVKILTARNKIDFLIFRYENIKINIYKNQSKNLFFLFVITVGFIIIFVCSTAFFAIRLKKSRISERKSFNFTKISNEAQENERKRFSMELHDTVAQNLRAIQLLSSEVFSLVENSDFSLAKDSQKDFLTLKEQIMELEKNSIIQIRTMCYNLTPPDLSRKDLRSALIHYCSTFKRDTNIDCTLIITEDVDFSFLTQQNQLNIFRLVQESLTNCSKHSKAKEVTVIAKNKIEGTAKFLYIIITDDGIGFDTKIIGNLKENFGLNGMIQRAQFLNGTLKINSEENEGTEIQIKIPVV